MLDFLFVFVLFFTDEFSIFMMYVKCLMPDFT